MLLELLITGGLITYKPYKPLEISTISKTEIALVEPIEAPTIEELPKLELIPIPKPKPATAPVRSSGGAPAGWYPYGWCTYGAWKMAPWVGAWGDAHTWDDRARRDGFIVNGTPVAGAVFVDNGGAMGHVGVVVSVGFGTVTVREMNFEGFGVWSSRVVPASSFVYIHP